MQTEAQVCSVAETCRTESHHQWQRDMSTLRNEATAPRQLIYQFATQVRCNGTNPRAAKSWLREGGQSRTHTTRLRHQVSATARKEATMRAHARVPRKSVSSKQKKESLTKAVQSERSDTHTHEDAQRHTEHGQDGDEKARGWVELDTRGCWGRGLLPLPFLFVRPGHAYPGG